MIHINNISVETEILNAKFACDLRECNGGCCTFPGDFGAPLLDGEIDFIRNSLDAASKYLSERSKSVIEINGFAEGSAGSMTTVCIDRRDCVFVFYEGDVAYCALERAFIDGMTSFRKPISCHLFPIRVGDSAGWKSLRYEKIPECYPATVKGENEGIALVENLEEGLKRAFGATWYKELIERLHELEKENFFEDKFQGGKT